MKETIESSVFGLLRLNHQLVNQTTYESELEIPNHGRATVAVTAIRKSEREWYSSLCSAEEMYPKILQAERELRLQASERIVAIHRDYWGRHWQSMPVNDLLSCLRLKHLNFFSDGTIELWYAAGEPFQHHDIRIEASHRLCITEVGIDG